MLRKLLHERTWAKAFELSGLPIRRRHKNQIRLKIENDGTIGTETEYSDSDDSDREGNTSSNCTDAEAAGCLKVLRQDAMDSPRTISSSYSSWGSNMGYVRYFDNNSDMHLDESQNLSNLTLKGDCTKDLFQAMYGFNEINSESDRNLDYDIVNAQNVFGGFPDLQEYEPHSERIENSSFEARPYMACEDLVNMDQNTQIETLGNDDKDFLPTRRSYPNCSVKVDTLPKQWKSTEENYTTRDSGGSLTSNLLQVLDPPSPKRCSHDIDSLIIDPPPMFRNEDDMKVINVNLNTNVPFRKHSLNSDKKIRRSMSRSMVETESNSNKDDGNRVQRMSSQSDNDKIHKKCECCNRSLCPSPRSSDSGVVGSCTLTSPDMHDYASSGNTGNDSDHNEKIPDRNNMRTPEEARDTRGLRRKLTLSDIEAATFEDQCRCTSPFGSTARTSCVTSVTSENSLDVTDTSNTHLKSTFAATPPVPTSQIKRTSIRRNIERYVPEIKLKPEPPPRVYRKPSTHLEVPKNVRQHLPCQWGTLNITERSKPSLHYHMRIYKDTSENVTDRKSRVNTPRNRDIFCNDKKQDSNADFEQVRKTRSRSEDLSKLQKGLAEGQSGFVVYRSDLYAHWWMKAKLPITVVTDSGKDYSFVKRYCLCITGLKIILP